MYSLPRTQHTTTTITKGAGGAEITDGWRYGRVAMAWPQLYKWPPGHQLLISQGPCHTDVFITKLSRQARLSSQWRWRQIQLIVPHPQLQCLDLTVNYVCVCAYICLFSTSSMCWDNQLWVLCYAYVLSGNKNYKEKKVSWTKSSNIYTNSDQQH